MHQILKLEAFHQSHTKFQAEMKHLLLKIFGNQEDKPSRNMPEGIMKDISTQRGEHTWNIVN